MARATSTFRNHLAREREREQRRVQLDAAGLGAGHRLPHDRRPASTAAASAHQYVTNTSLRPRTRRVGRGSVWPRSARMTARTRGRTKVSRKMTAPVPTTKSSAG